ncbi:MAG: hypothetical protein KDG50_10235 [Chromatiales bacterium]|nr:hypothetical protein [Chromatiales bacterium]
MNKINLARALLHRAAQKEAARSGVPETPLRIGIGTSGNMVAIKFNIPVNVVTITGEHARNLAAMLTKQADEIDARMPPK